MQHKHQLNDFEANQLRAALNAARRLIEGVIPSLPKDLIDNREDSKWSVNDHLNLAGMDLIHDTIKRAIGATAHSFAPLDQWLRERYANSEPQTDDQRREELSDQLAHLYTEVEAIRSELNEISERNSFLGRILQTIQAERDQASNNKIPGKVNPESEDG